MSASNDMETAILNAMYRGIDLVAATSITLALHSADPTDADLSNELSGNGYARQTLVVGAPVDGSVSNTALITFTASGGDWATATHFSVRDGSTGDMISHGVLTNSITVVDGASLNFQIGDLTLSAD